MAAKVKLERGAYWVVTHFEGKRRKRRVGPTKADRRKAEGIATKINAALALGTFAPDDRGRSELPFDAYAADWVRREVMLPIERGEPDHLAPSTAATYASHVKARLQPHFGKMDVRDIDVRAVQGLYDACVDAEKPLSPRTVAKSLVTLSLVLSHARQSGVIEVNAVEQWRAGRKRRRRSSIDALTPDRVLSPEELQRFLDHAKAHYPHDYLLIVLLADTGMRIGEATALRWIDVDLERGTVRVARSYSTGRYLGPTKSGRERLVELTTRLQQLLRDCRPNIFGDEALVCPGEDRGFLEVSAWRRRVFANIARKVLGRGRAVTPHTLRHSYASIHLSRGTNLLWVQRQGGWQSPTVLLSTYAHFLPTELTGFADALTARNGTRRHQPGEKASAALA